MRHPHPVRDRAGEPDGVGRAAGRLGVVVRVAPTARASPRRRRAARSTSSAATAESTPPLIATSVRPGSGGERGASRAAAPSARCSASAARSAACSLPGESPPSSAAISRVPDARRVEQRLARRRASRRPSRRRSARRSPRRRSRRRRPGRPRRARETRIRSPQTRAAGVPSKAPGDTPTAPHGRGEVLGRSARGPSSADSRQRLTAQPVAPARRWRCLSKRAPAPCGRASRRREVVGQRLRSVPACHGGVRGASASLARTFTTAALKPCTSPGRRAATPTRGGRGDDRPPRSRTRSAPACPGSVGQRPAVDARVEDREQTGLSLRR